jgi:uncharacterized protein YaiE (UPF0345 family)
MKYNVYFEGKVQSLGINEREGYATIGVIESGAYSFSTSFEERMTVVAGAMNVRLPGGEWKSYIAGERFVVPPKISFDIEAKADVGYICRYR